MQGFGECWNTFGHNDECICAADDGFASVIQHGMLQTKTPIFMASFPSGPFIRILHSDLRVVQYSVKVQM